MTLLTSTAVAVTRKGAPPLRFAPLSLARGKKTLILGPSGCGKTTLLSVLAGLLPPASGAVTLDGHDLYKLPARERDRLRGRHFGFIFQTLHLLPSLTLRQNVELAADIARKSDPARIDALLDNLDLSAKAHRRPDALSQGEQQRAAIARAVLNRPAVIIADEPTSALDDVNTAAAMDLLCAQAAETGAALLVATHDSRITKHFDTILRLDAQVKEAA